MTRRYKFHIDLRALNRVAPPQRDDGFQLSEQLREQVGDTSRWELLQRAIEAVPELSSWSPEWQDPLLGEEMMMTYNASLRRARSARPGAYERNAINFNVFFDSDGIKHVVSRPVHEPHDRVSELMISPNGIILRLAYERVTGPRQNTDDLFEDGLCALDSDEEAHRFVRYPGYELRQERFEPEQETLVDVLEQVLFYDLERRELAVRPVAPD
ncbi:MAG: hypothetical protein AB7S38_07485 [Vulcanimicrobiota bacterium]